MELTARRWWRNAHSLAEFVPQLTVLPLMYYWLSDCGLFQTAGSKCEDKAPKCDVEGTEKHCNVDVIKTTCKKLCGNCK